MNKFIYSRPSDNGVCVVYPASKELVEEALGPISDKVYETILKASSIPTDAQNIASVESIDADIYFREAWTIDPASKKLSIDETKARAVKMAELRAKRNAKLSALDTQSMRATEAGDQAKLKEVADLKQKLRDLPQTVDLNNMSLDALKAFQPDILAATQPAPSVSVAPVVPETPEAPEAPEVSPVITEAPEVEPVTPETLDPKISPSTQGADNGK